MKRKRRKPSEPMIPPQAIESREEGTEHLRLCHLCLHLNESTILVESCQRCGKALIGNRLGGSLAEDADPFMDGPEMVAQQSAQQVLPEIDAILPGIAGLEVRW